LTRMTTKIKKVNRRSTVSSADRRAFDMWLFKVTRDAVGASTHQFINEESIVKKNVDHDHDDDNDGSQDAGVSGDDAGKQSQDRDEKIQRGGQQQAKAAIRSVPAPSEDALTLTMVVDKLNAVRSGKSLKDEGVRKRLGEYFVDLNPIERLALFAFLEGLAEIVAADVPGEHARAPNDPDINVEMHADDVDLEDSDEPDAQHVRVKHAGNSGSVSGGRRKGSTTAQHQHQRQVGDVDDDPDDGPILVVKR
jgi:hypothetical protein